MTLLKRTKNIISAKVQSHEQACSNPERDIEKAIEEMSSLICGLEKSAAAALAEKKLTERQIEEMEGEQAKWLENAKRAVGAGQDDLARQALLQKKSISKDIANCKKYLDNTTENFKYLSSEIKASREKYEELKTKVSLVKHKNLMNKLGMGNKSTKEEEEGILELKFETLRKTSKNAISIDDELENMKSKLKK